MKITSDEAVLAERLRRSAGKPPPRAAVSETRIPGTAGTAPAVATPGGAAGTPGCGLGGAAVPVDAWRLARLLEAMEGRRELGEPSCGPAGAEEPSQGRLVPGGSSPWPLVPGRQSSGDAPCDPKRSGTDPSAALWPPAREPPRQGAGSAALRDAAVPAGREGTLPDLFGRASTFARAPQAGADAPCADLEQPRANGGGPFVGAAGRPPFGAAERAPGERPDRTSPGEVVFGRARDAAGPGTTHDARGEPATRPRAELRPDAARVEHPARFEDGVRADAAARDGALRAEHAGAEHGGRADAARRPELALSAAAQPRLASNAELQMLAAFQWAGRAPAADSLDELPREALRAARRQRIADFTAAADLARAARRTRRVLAVAVVAAMLLAFLLASSWAAACPTLPSC